MAQPALQLHGAAERFLDGHLLVQREPDQQRERFLDEEAVGGVIPGERQAVHRARHAPMVIGADLPFAQAGSPSYVHAYSARMSAGVAASGSQPVDDPIRPVGQHKETEMASTPMVRADVYGLLPSILILLMLILASLGIVAHAATL